MKRMLSYFMMVSVLAVLGGEAAARGVAREHNGFLPPPGPGAQLPGDLSAAVATRSAAAADTFVLHEATFEGPGGVPDPMGYVSVDLTEQIATFFHVADASELDGGSGGFMVPLSGSRSMWCGQAPSSAVPFCGYGTLPGYGHRWNQWLVSDPLPGDSVSLSYRVFWDSESGYDYTTVEYSFDGGATWSSFNVGNAVSGIPGVYDNVGPTPYVDESLTVDSPGASEVRIRFRFESDAAYSDEDGLYDSDGAIIVDNIAVQTWNGGVPAANEFEDFESAPVGGHTAGVWTATPSPAYGDFAALYPGGVVYQDGDCYTNPTFFWGFFDDPMVTSYDCHLPDPLPNQGAVPFGKVVDGEEIYLENEIWSPVFANMGQGDEYLLGFQLYDDLPLDNLVLHTYKIRSWTDGCPGPWRSNQLCCFPYSPRWVDTYASVGKLVDPGADELQIALGVLDACSFWCGTPVGTGTCHSHAPLFDNVRVQRVSFPGPQLFVRHIELFQDNFADDGTLTGTARADCANDILPSTNPAILPGDSVAMSITGVGEVGPGMGPRAYLYAAVWPLGSKTGASLGSPDTRPGKAGPRFPYVGNEVINGITWERFQMDSAFTSYGVVVQERYCVDLNDALFTPGDTICYFFGADEDAVDHSGNEIYWHRTLGGQGSDRLTDDIAEAAASPCEFTILPAGGYNRGGDILFVDDADDRGGPAQLFFDSVFEAAFNVLELIDRYDVLGPSSVVGNGLDSRVKDRVAQIIDTYSVILWSSSNLSSGTIGDGVGPEKSDDFGLLEQFIATSPDDPGLYLFGDNIAEEWVTLSGTGAQNLRNQWMPFALVDGDHIAYGEPVTPLLTATGTSFIHQGVPDKFYIYGGCPVINDFDVLQPLSSSIATTIIEFPYPNNGDGAVISAQDTNLVNSIYTILLTGFGFDYIRDASLVQGPYYAMARAEFLGDAIRKSGAGPLVPTGIDPDTGPELVYELGANYPNPFNPVTTIEYRIKERTHVSLNVYNAAGQLVRTLVDDVQSPADVKPLTWDGTNNAGQGVSSGVYFYRMVTKDFVKTRKMVLLK